MISGMRSTIAASADSPRSVSPAATSAAGSPSGSHALAGFAFAAKIVLQALAIRGLCKHARQRVFADPARPRKEQSAGRAVAAQHPAQRGDDAFVAEKFVEAHSAALSRYRQESVRDNRRQNFFVDCFGRAQRNGRGFAGACGAIHLAERLGFNLMNSLAR